MVWYLASGAQGPRINTRLGHSRLGYRIDLGSLQILNLIGSIYWLNWEFRYPDGSFENWANELWESHLFPNPYVLFYVFECRNWRWLAAAT